jgi:DHA1 family multidrug resistance protein-like MFS transporter
MTQPTSTEPRSFWQALNRPTLALLALQLMGGMILAPQSTFFPIYVKDLGYSAMLIANLVTAKQIAGLISSLVGGTLSDSLGRKRTLLLGNAGFLLSSFAFLVVSPNWIGLLWAIGGFGLGLHTLGGQSYLMDAAAASYLGLISALFNWGYTLGGALSSPIAGLLLDRWDYAVFAGALIAFSAGTIAVNQFILPRSPVTRQARAPGLKRFFGYGDVALRPTVLMLAALRFLPTVYYATMLILIPLLLDAAGATKTIIALYATVSWVVASLAQGVVGRAADRLGPKSSTAMTFGALLVSVLGPGLWPSNLWVVFTFGTVGIAAAWSLSTLLPSLVAEATVPEERGRVLGFIHLWWNLAMVVGSMAGGALFEIASGLPFLVAGAANLFSLALLFVFYRLVAKAQYPGP